MRAKVAIATLGLLLVGSLTAYAYVAVTASATVTVNEALYIDSAMLTIGTNAHVCTIAADKASATCAIDAYPGEQGTLGIQIANRGSAALTTTQTASSSSGDVALTLRPPTASVPGGAGVFFAVDFAVSPSAIPGAVTISVSFSR